MGVEVLVYIYLAVCLAMILFNIWTIIHSRRREKINERLTKEYTDRIQKELEKIRRGEEMGKKHISLMKRRLRRQEHLLVFTQVMIELYGESPDEIRQYLDRLFPALDKLTPHYEKQSDPIRYAFFLYSLKVFGKMSGVTPPKVEETLMRAVRAPNTYCRENALQAIYATGETRLVIRALQILDSGSIFHNHKLLSDGLLSFKGDKTKLIDDLWDVFESFHPGMQTVILDYIRFCAPGHQERILSLLKDKKRDPELRFSCLRYFGKYPYEAAYPVLLELAGDLNNLRWEYPAIACSSLASYPGEKTVEVLKRAVHSDNWFVRYNAADSLLRLKNDYTDLIDIIDGKDRYAREILQFQLDMQYNREKGATAQ